MYLGILETSSVKSNGIERNFENVFNYVLT